ncbi:MAG TPA: hypothetical protein VFH56_07040 [Acidimicrobiales bacterium]|nr:hypothetical protein [Acidimicrobiales bacterium]
MAKNNSRQPKIGDIIEFETPNGFAYAQFSHFHDKPPQFGYLLRILQGTFEFRPTSFAALAAGEDRFNVFFPLAASLRAGEVKIVANEPVPERCRSFPLFRNGVRDPRTGRVKVWWLWDGVREWKVGELTDELRQLSFLRISDATAIVERITRQYSPFDEV